MTAYGRICYSEGCPTLIRKKVELIAVDITLKTKRATPKITSAGARITRNVD